MAAAKQADICLGCNKKFKKTETSVQCTVCGLWCHKDCAAISNEFLKFLEEQKKNTGLAYWACRPCIVYAQGITKRVQEIEKRLETVEERTKMTVENVGKLEQRVEKIGGQQDKMGEKLDRKIEQSENRIFEELRERDAKKLNIIMHGVKEAAGGERSGERRAAWDMEKIVGIFVFLELGLTEEDVKFCRRVGERGEAPRALVVGFHTEAARGQILRYAKYLAETDYEHI
jgi:hypothetical protein